MTVGAREAGEKPGTKIETAAQVTGPRNTEGVNDVSKRK